MGALPGDKNDKLMDFAGPFIDHCGKAADRIRCAGTVQPADP